MSEEKMVRVNMTIVEKEGDVEVKWTSNAPQTSANILLLWRSFQQCAQQMKDISMRVAPLIDEKSLDLLGNMKGKEKQND